MKVSEFLTEATWCQEYYAVDRVGIPVEPRSEIACKWCLAGAIEKCYPYFKEKSDTYDRVLEAIDAENYGSISEFNDDPKTTFNDIQRAILEAGI